MTGVLHWQIREIMPLISDPEFRMLIALNSRTNVRNRCWPSTEQIMKDTSLSNKSVTVARKGLLDKSAIELVKYGKRLDEERDLPARQFVYQLTGKMHINGRELFYLFIANSSDESVPATPLKVYGVHDVPATPKVVTGSTEVNKEEDPRATLIARAVRLYEAAFGAMPSALIADQLQDYADLYTLEWVEDALKEAAINNAKSMAYVRAVLLNWRRDGRKPAEQPKPPARTGSYVNIIEPQYELTKDEDARMWGQHE